MKEQPCLSFRFWSSFARKHWEKSPLVVKQPFAVPITTASELFCAMVAARTKLGQREKRCLRCFIDKKVRRSKITKNLPRQSDGTFQGYRKRIGQSLGGARFGLVVVDYPEFDGLVRRKVGQFLRELREMTEIRVKSKTLLFLGDYARTPVGIHQDPHGTFVFVIQGRKRFRTWPFNFFFDAEKITGTLNYRKFLKDAVTLEGAAGDLIYWPSSYWHIGESIGGFSISLNVGVFT